MVSSQRVRLLLLSIFLAFFTVGTISLLHLAWATSTGRNGLWEDDASEVAGVLFKLWQVYSVPLSAMLASFLVKARSTNKKVSSSLSAVALLVVLFWNVTIQLPVMLLAWGNQVVVFKSTLAQIDNIAAAGGFLLVGVLTYFFSKAESSAATKS